LHRYAIASSVSFITRQRTVVKTARDKTSFALQWHRQCAEGRSTDAVGASRQCRSAVSRESREYIGDICMFERIRRREAGRVRCPTAVEPRGGAARGSGEVNNYTSDVCQTKFNTGGWRVASALELAEVRGGGELRGRPKDCCCLLSFSLGSTVIEQFVLPATVMTADFDSGTDPFGDIEANFVKRIGDVTSAPRSLWKLPLWRVKFDRSRILFFQQAAVSV
jgi:hypothetical protein